jgi:hypothetical protein
MTHLIGVGRHVGLVVDKIRLGGTSLLILKLLLQIGLRRARGRRTTRAKSGRMEL